MADANPYEAPYKTPLEAMAWIDRETQGGKHFSHAFSVVPVNGGFAVKIDSEEVSRTA